MALVATMKFADQPLSVIWWKVGDNLDKLTRIIDHAEFCKRLFVNGDEFQRILQYTKGWPNLSNIEDSSMTYVGDFARMLAVNLGNIFQYPNDESSTESVMAINSIVALSPENAVKIGDCVADMHIHEPNSMICKNWSVQSGMPIEIGEDTFYDLVLRHDIDSGQMMNKYAHVIGITKGADEFITAVLVIYRYDTSYYLSMLWAR